MLAPSALEFAKKFNVIGYDINSKRVADLNLGVDATMEVSEKQLNNVLCPKSIIKISVLKLLQY